MTSKNSPASDFESAYIQPALARRREFGSLRRLTPFHKKNMVDFSSNDYLGLAHSRDQHAQVTVEYQKLARHLLGSTGSRLLTGDSEYAQKLENRLATWHNRPAALVCNSGYDANLAVLSCVTRQNVVIMDELCHNSLYMGVQLGQGKPVTFKHNNVQDLERVLQKQSANQRLLIAVESVYSMDGDIGPLSEILELALLYNASVIVDEAHGLGVFGSNGMGVLAHLRLERHPALLCSIHTFGKAGGCHGGTRIYYYVRAMFVLLVYHTYATC
jgi:8-amino-7-oxononanoate synthase